MRLLWTDLYEVWRKGCDWEAMWVVRKIEGWCCGCEAFTVGVSRSLGDTDELKVEMVD
jgi:hypothetical protein